MSESKIIGTIMYEDNNNQRINTDEGIIVEASLEILKKAVEKVLFEFSEEILTAEGVKKYSGDPVVPGDSILFEEHIKPSPAQVVIIKIDEDLWYVISTSETPTGGYPSGRDAMRATQAEEKRLRIIKEFLSEQTEVKKVEDVRNWQPDMRAEAVDVLDIINMASKRWIR
ncbi:hypothetical protein EU527_07845 [Candidatus Thorarchaeota archaeon]|nr:MAG: hypothetical protein EU527_07845 [Candidatus Thorarchaeota archaeon]